MISNVKTPLLYHKGGSLSLDYDYRAFGILITETENVDSPFEFTGRAREPGGLSHMHYYRNRYYMPGNGIFTSRDAMWADVHRGWGYVGNMPTWYVDPYGLNVNVLGDDGFADKIADALQKCIGDCAKVTKEPKGDTGWTIKLTDIKDSDDCGCAAHNNMERLNEAIDSDRDIDISFGKGCPVTYPVNLNSLNSSNPFIRADKRPPQVTNAEVCIDPSHNEKRPTFNPADNSRGPELKVPWPAAVWHEVIGHGNELIHNRPADHPKEDWNHWEYPLDRHDPIIDIENMCRQVTGDPLRWPQYYDKKK